jgi:hypothetical protein
MSHDIMSRHRPRGRTAPALAAILTAILAAAFAVPALAQRAGAHPRAHPGAGGRAASAAHEHYDGRFSNNHYYYDRGYTVRRPPPGSIGDLRGPHGGRYWYHRGNWYRRNGAAWVVWGAPIGVYVPWLPSYFTTVWWYGVPYYYANDTYYVWDSDRSQYQVVAPPAGIEQGATTQAPPSDRLFAYPDKGQSAEQQSQDEYECHRSASAQSGFDPTLPGGGVPAEQAVQKRNDYFRADAACLKARGYTVR